MTGPKTHNTHPNRPRFETTHHRAGPETGDVDRPGTRSPSSGEMVALFVAVEAEAVNRPTPVEAGSGFSHEGPSLTKDAMYGYVISQ